MNIVQSGSRLQVYGEDVQTFKEIPVGSYDVCFNKMTGFYLSTRYDLEANEDIFDAMIREVKEELLINLTREDIKIIHLMHHYTGERLNFIFEADGTNLKPEIGEKNKCSELRWAAMESLPSETTAKVKLIINNILENKFYDKL